jgi:GNAT superfamily N-acetyltransferase
MEDLIKICTLKENLITAITESLIGTNVSRSEEYLIRCLRENEAFKRITCVALVGSEVAGLVNLIYESEYPFFKGNNIPEINDLLVHPKFRNQGIGKLLISEMEKEAAKTYAYIGLGVGLYKDYGSAQKLYTENGYILDGNGLMYKNTEVKPGRDVFVDDDLLLYLYKKIR